MAISVAAVVCVVTAIVMSLIYDMKKSKIESVALIAKIAGDRNSAALAFGSKESIQHNLEIYHFSPSIRAVCIYTEGGDLFGEYEPDAKSGACAPKFSLLPDKVSGFITVKDKIVHEGSMLGHIYVISDTSEIDVYIAKISKIGAAAAAFTLMVMLGASAYFSKHLANAIGELTSTIQSITESKNYSLKAKTYYNDELGILAKAFNKMLNEVLKRDIELAVANEMLEEKISIRTRELLEAKHRAELASEAKSEFLRNMSHEFRTPLHAIMSFSAYGIKEFKDSERAELKKYFEQINKGSERLTKLVNEVLELAQLEKGTYRFSMQYRDIRELADRACELVASLMQDKNIKLCISHYPGVVGAECDQDKITQVITNMLSNAIKFTPRDKAIIVRTRVVNGMSQLSIIDEGVGIPESERESIFESFRQSSRTNAGTGGTGLGLAICREIITAHKGKIWAENNPSFIGACVTFSLAYVVSPPKDMAKDTGNNNQEVSHVERYQT